MNLRCRRRTVLALGAGVVGAAGVRAQVPPPLAGLQARMATAWPDVQSVVALQRGGVRFEFYRAGVSADSLQDVQSVTKSVLALLFGCALADGRVRGVDELVAQRLPRLLRLGGDARLRRLRFAHLLSMTAGWPGELTARRDRDDDLRWLALRPFVAEPGARFAYDNGAANLLALALANAVGQPLAEYARERLLAPLCITRLAWRRGRRGRRWGRWVCRSVCATWRGWASWCWPKAAGAGGRCCRPTTCARPPRGATPAARRCSRPMATCGGCRPSGRRAGTRAAPSWPAAMAASGCTSIRSATR